MKKNIVLICFLLGSLETVAQFEIFPVNRIIANPVLIDGGYILGIDELFITITDVWQEKKYNTFKISGYVQNTYNRESSDHMFEIYIYDSTGSQQLLYNSTESQKKVEPTRKFVSEKHGMFTIYLKEDEIAEVYPLFASAYPVRIYIKK